MCGDTRRASRGSATEGAPNAVRSRPADGEERLGRCERRRWRHVASFAGELVGAGRAAAATLVCSAAAAATAAQKPHVRHLQNLARGSGESWAGARWLERGRRERARADQLACVLSIPGNSWAAVRNAQHAWQFMGRGAQRTCSGWPTSPLCRRRRTSRTCSLPAAPSCTRPSSSLAWVSARPRLARSPQGQAHSRRSEKSQGWVGAEQQRGRPCACASAAPALAPPLTAPLGPRASLSSATQQPRRGVRRQCKRSTSCICRTATRWRQSEPGGEMCAGHSDGQSHPTREGPQSARTTRRGI